MPKLGLRPFATIEEGLDTYLGYNFTRLENVFERIEDTKSDVVSVTGSTVVNTGLAIVTGVVASLVTDPVAGAAYVTAVPGAAGTVTIKVFSSGFAASVIAVSVQWIASGELVLA